MTVTLRVELPSGPAELKTNNLPDEVYKDCLRWGFERYYVNNPDKAEQYIRRIQPTIIVRFHTHGEDCWTECQTVKAAQAIWDAAKAQPDVEMRSSRPT